MASATLGNPRITKGKAFWQDHIDQWHQSGLSKIGYCRDHGMSKSTFDSWFKKLQQPRQESKRSRDFLSLHLQQETPIKNRLSPAPSPTSTIEIQLPKDIIVKVNSPIDLDALFQVLHLVRQLP